jgi:dipeptidyl-peptidase-4
VAGGALLQLVRLAPVGNALVFVLDNDIYYRSSSSYSAEEKRVTFNGIPGILYNGVPDWVYEGNRHLKRSGYFMYMTFTI